MIELELELELEPEIGVGGLVNQRHRRGMAAEGWQAWEPAAVSRGGSACCGSLGLGLGLRSGLLQNIALAEPGIAEGQHRHRIISHTMI